MAKNDYEVIVYKILIYLYAIMKREIVFDRVVFDNAIRKDVISDEYLADILRMMQAEGLIEGVVVTKAWGSVYILTSGIEDISITADGIGYLKDNNKGAKIKQSLIDSADIVASLIGILNL